MRSYEVALLFFLHQQTVHQQNNVCRMRSSIEPLTELLGSILLNHHSHKVFQEPGEASEREGGSSIVTHTVLSPLLIRT